MRDVQFQTSYLIHPAGSCLASYGDTKVICTVSLEDRVPSFLEGRGCGWLTAEYGMLPGSTGAEESSGRSVNGTAEVPRFSVSSDGASVHPLIWRNLANGP